MSRALTPFWVEAGFWLLLCGGLAAGIGAETDWGRQLRIPVREIVVTPADFSRPVLTEPYRLPPPDQFLEITVRPVFVITRRPAPIPPPPEPPKPTMIKGQFVLTGVTIVSKGKFAFLLEKAGNKARVVAEGKEINGIMVKEIAADRVVLSQFGDMEVLMMRTSRQPPVGAGGVPGMPGILPGQRGPTVAP